MRYHCLACVCVCIYIYIYKTTNMYHNVISSISTSEMYKKIKSLSLSGCCIHSVRNHCQTLLGCVCMEIQKQLS